MDEINKETIKALQKELLDTIGLDNDEYKIDDTTAEDYLKKIP